MLDDTEFQYQEVINVMVLKKNLDIIKSVRKIKNVGMWLKYNSFTLTDKWYYCKGMEKFFIQWNAITSTWCVSNILYTIHYLHQCVVRLIIRKHMAKFQYQCQQAR